MTEDTPVHPGAGREREIFVRYYHPVHRFFMGRGFSHEDAEDLTQDTFARVFKHMGQLENQDVVELWIFSIAANIWKNELRFLQAAKRHAKMVSLDTALQSAPDAIESDLVKNSPDVPNPLDAVLDAERLGATNRCLDELAPRMRSCLLLHVAAGLHYREVAELLQISIHSVGSHIHQAREHLKSCLGRRLDGGPR
jgi:RNA polymerase sigma-70 factor (ECF subfamily)